MVIKGVTGFRNDYEEHILHGRCLGQQYQPVPCMALCPAHVNVPGYISLIREGRYSDAVELIRKDNPLPAVCGLICEHPCEEHCRRTFVDDRSFYAPDRAEVLYGQDAESTLRFSHENPSIKAVYADYFGAPLSHLSHELLHTDHTAWKMPGEE